ncbi:MAG: hypothetical protein ABGZ35_11295, partial [Planctomycetaceae bacterium]
MTQIGVRSDNAIQRKELVAHGVKLNRTACSPTRNRRTRTLALPGDSCYEVLLVPANTRETRRRMAEFDLVIHGGTIIDGLGAARRPGDVGIRGDR